MKDLKYYQNLPYKLIVAKEDDYFIAYYREFPKVIGSGDDEMEAICDFKAAFASMIEEHLAAGEQIKEPFESEEKQKVTILLKTSTIKAIKNFSPLNRSAFLDKAARYVIDNQIRL